MKMADSTQSSRLSIISYNLHGYNQGLPGCTERTDRQTESSVIAYQEHWLTTDNLDKLNNISIDYFVCGSSAMDASVGAGPLVGRLFGGTAILITKSLISVTNIIVSRERYTVIKIANWLVINAYMPCSGTNDRYLLYCDILSELQDIIDNQSDCDILMCADLNTELSSSSILTSAVNGFIASNNMHRCDVLFPSANVHTYMNESLHCASTIDYMLTSNSSQTVAFNVIDLDINLSDHCPLLTVLNVCLSGNSVSKVNNGYATGDEVTYLRWDHSPLDLYYEYTRIKLQPVLIDLDALVNNCDTISDDCILEAIDSTYTIVADTLLQGSELYIMKVKKNFLKFWWCQELDELKEKAIGSCRLWRDAGKPRNGQLHEKYIRDKLSYKKRIREERNRETSCFTNDLHEALLHKSGQDFGKSWNSKFEQKN